MKLPISPRLLACAQLVPPCRRAADVGCDHGYLAIHLLQSGAVESVIASDINEMPLQSALHNAVRYGVREKMSFYLSDGVRNIPRDFDCLICAGMGGDTMVSILEAAPWLRSDQYTLILQCQSKTPLLRRYLSDNGWAIDRETILRDGKFLYTVIRALWDPAAPRLTVGGWYLPPAALENPPEIYAEYRNYVLQGLRITLAHQENPEKHRALQELEGQATEI